MIIEQIARETGVGIEDLDAIIRTASNRYKTYPIRKRTGGFREINQPSPVVKFLQRWVVRNFISHLPVHTRVMSYRQGLSVYENAGLHVAQKYLLKIDFENFFPSIKDADVGALLLRNAGNQALAGLDARDFDVITRIVCRNGELTIGAPSSPAISNAILFNFDEFVATESSRRGVVYSRYADDVSLSSSEPNALSEIFTLVDGFLREQRSPRLTINADKTVFTSKKRKRMVTGLVLTSEEKISIGREKKRKIKSLCHLFRVGRLSVGDASYLRGYLSYASSVEPAFVDALKRKFGDEVIVAIMGTAIVRRK